MSRYNREEDLAAERIALIRSSDQLGARKVADNPRHGFCGPEEDLAEQHIQSSCLHSPAVVQAEERAAPSSRSGPAAVQAAVYTDPL